MKFVFTAILINIMTYLSAQNVGIGINNPTRAKLELNGAVDATTAIFGGDTTGISLQRNWPGIGYNSYWNLGNRGISSGYGAKQSLDPGTGYMFLEMLSTGAANDFRSSKRVLAISPTGLIGLGGVTPNAEFQLPNILKRRRLVLWEKANNDNEFFGFGIESGALTYNVGGTGDEHRFYSGFNSASSTLLMTITAAKRVLIGQQDQNFRLGINTTNPIYTIEMLQADNKGLGFINPLNGYHKWEIKGESYSAGVSDGLYLYYDGGTWPSGWFRPTDGGYTNLSDRRLKQDILPMGNVLPKLMQLQASSYHFKNDPSQHTSIGFIAQDVKKVFPELVDVIKTDGKEISELQGLNYTGFSVIAIQAIQEQQVQIESLQKENAAIKKELEEVKKLLSTLIKK